MEHHVQEQSCCCRDRWRPGTTHDAIRTRRPYIVPVQPALALWKPEIRDMRGRDDSDVKCEGGTVACWYIIGSESEFVEKLICRRHVPERTGNIFKNPTAPNDMNSSRNTRKHSSTQALRCDELTSAVPVGLQEDYSWRDTSTAFHRIKLCPELCLQRSKAARER